MPERDHEHVPLADRVAVPAGIAEIVLRYDLISDRDCRTGISQAPCIEPPDLNIISAFLYQLLNGNFLPV